MCAKCFEAARSIFPGVPEGEVGNFLMNCTAFPLAEPEYIEKQLKELRAKTNNYQECYAIVEEEMEKLSKEPV
jgi:hypothetical protein